MQSLACIRASIPWPEHISLTDRSDAASTACAPAEGVPLPRHGIKHRLPEAGAAAPRHVLHQRRSGGAPAPCLLSSWLQSTCRQPRLPSNVPEVTGHAPCLLFLWPHRAVMTVLADAPCGNHQREQRCRSQRGCHKRASVLMFAGGTGCDVPRPDQRAGGGAHQHQCADGAQAADRQGRCVRKRVSESSEHDQRSIMRSMRRVDPRDRTRGATSMLVHVYGSNTSQLLSRRAAPVTWPGRDKCLRRRIDALSG